MKLLIKNFRSIREQELELAPLTVVYGPNGTGKSTLLYAPLTLKNIVLNPNQQIPGFFNYQFTSLGGLREVVFDHDLKNELELGIALEQENWALKYRVTLKDNNGTFNIHFSGPLSSDLQLSVAFPYPANQQAHATLAVGLAWLSIFWTGIVANVRVDRPMPEVQQKALDLEAALNSPTDYLSGVSFV